MPSPSNASPRVLCVDDRVASLEVRRALLTQKGYDVLIVSDPPSALSIVDKVHIDLVLLDYSFPGHMSGDELARQLRAKEPGLPLIMLSGYPDLPDNVADSVDVVLLKGSSQPADLLNAMTELLRGPQPQDQSDVRNESPRVRDRSRQLMDKSQELMARSKTNMPENEV